MAEVDEESWSRLMRQAEAGDQDAYRRLLTAVKRPLLAYVMRRVREPTKAEDIVQTILLRIHMSRHTYDAKQAFAPWMYTIARNIIVDHFRSESRYASNVTLMEELPEAPAEAEDGGVKDRFEQAFDGLSDDQKQAIKLVKMDGLSMEEAAKATGVSVSAFKVRAHRAYKAFRAALDGGDE